MYARTPAAMNRRNRAWSKSGCGAPATLAPPNVNRIFLWLSRGRRSAMQDLQTRIIAPIPAGPPPTRLEQDPLDVFRNFGLRRFRAGNDGVALCRSDAAKRDPAASPTSARAKRDATGRSPLEALRVRVDAVTVDRVASPLTIVSVAAVLLRYGTFVVARTVGLARQAL